MGNKDSRHDRHDHHHHNRDHAAAAHGNAEHGSRDAETERTFKEWSDKHGGVSKETVERVFGPMLGPKLWRYLNGSSDGGKPSIETKFAPLVNNTSNDVVLQMLAGEDGFFKAQDVEEMIHICRACAGVGFNGSMDDKMIGAVVSAVVSGNEKVAGDDVRNWIEFTCPRLMSSLKRTVATGIRTAVTQCDAWIGPKSKLLSPMKIWLIQCSVPSYLIKSEISSPAEYLSDFSSMPSCAAWDLLYSSEDDGLSPNRFENKVFNYRSPTVMVAEMFNGDLFCVCTDEEWRFSTQRWGKSGCAVYRLHPKFELVESGGITGMILFNTKQRGVPQGLFVGSNPKSPHFTIDADFSNVRSIEVWGCGSSESFLAQQNQRQWEKRQVEKQQKIPLPGNWEDSPDRMLLEMAGVKTQHAEK